MKINANSKLKGIILPLIRYVLSLDWDEFRCGSDVNGYFYIGKRETGIACATWKSYWEEKRKGDYDCHKTAL